MLVDYVFAQLASRKKEDFPLPKTVRLNPKMRWRSEDFGATFFVGSRFACYLNLAGLKLVQSLPSGVDFSTPDLIESLGVGQGKLVVGLVERGIFVAVN